MSTPVSAMSDPTERSMPAVMITKVCPAARIALTEIWRSTLTTLPGARKSPWVRPLRTPNSTTKPATRPAVRRAERRRFLAVSAAAAWVSAVALACRFATLSGRRPGHETRDGVLRRFPALELRHHASSAHHDHAHRHAQDLGQLG